MTSGAHREAARDRIFDAQRIERRGAKVGHHQPREHHDGGGEARVGTEQPRDGDGEGRRHLPRHRSQAYRGWQADVASERCRAKEAREGRDAHARTDRGRVGGDERAALEDHEAEGECGGPEHRQEQVAWRREHAAARQQVAPQHAGEREPRAASEEGHGAQGGGGAGDQWVQHLLQPLRHDRGARGEGGERHAEEVGIPGSERQPRHR